MTAPVKVHGANRRSDNDALDGTLVKAVSGPNAGLVGTFERGLAYGGDGYPTSVLVQEALTGKLVTCVYSDLRPTGEFDQHTRIRV